jgi:hypothetical protein
MSSERGREGFAQAGGGVGMDRDTGRSRAVRLRRMAPASEAEAAVKRFNGQEVDGRTLKVESRGPGTTFSLAPSALGRNASEHPLVFSNSSGARSSLIIAQ